MEAFFTNPTSFPYVERAILVKEIKLTKIYKELKSIETQFYIPVLMPKINDSSSSINKSKSAPSKRGFKGDNINTSGYTSSNTATLVIPRYLLLQFITDITETSKVNEDTIPKGTEFLVACVGGSMDADKMRIIGIYSLDQKEVM